MVVERKWEMEMWSAGEARWWELRACGGVADNDVGLWTASFFFSARFFLLFVLPWKGERGDRQTEKEWERERERERERKGRKLTIWFVRSCFMSLSLSLSSLLFSSGTVNLSYEGCKLTNTHGGHLFILRPVCLYVKLRKCVRLVT